MNDLAEITTEEQLRNTLFETWTYPDEKIGLRWDPAEDKRYALAWRNPSQDPTRAHGIAAVFRSQRITVGKLRNFTPARAI